MSEHAAHSADPHHQPSELAFYRWLHRSYCQTSALRYFLVRRLRPAGLGLLMVGVVLGMMGMGHERSAIYQVFSFAFAMGVIALPWAICRRARLEAVRELPRHGTAGEPLRYSVVVTNGGRRRVGRAWLLETEPDPRPPLDEFIRIREPGEEERNAFDRRFVYFRWQWLLLRRRLFAGSLPSTDEIRLKPAARTRLTMEITPLRRGIVRLTDLRAVLPDPFGFFQNCVRVKAPAATLTVLPRRYRLPPLEMPGGVPFKISGETNTNALGNSGEFVGLRDYRPEDPMRLIHWKSWARLGRPIVKELEDTHYPRYGLVLDCHSTSRDDTGFEEAVSVAASFASAIDTSESLLDLMFVKNEAHRVTVGRGVERAEKLLEVLAGVTPERSGDHQPLARLVLKHRDDLTSCIVVLNGWDESRAEMLRLLDQGGVIHIPFIVGEGAKPAGLPGHWLEIGRIGECLGRLPSRL